MWSSVGVGGAELSSVGRCKLFFPVVTLSSRYLSLVETTPACDGLDAPSMEVEKGWLVERRLRSSSGFVSKRVGL